MALTAQQQASLASISDPAKKASTEAFMNEYNVSKAATPTQTTIQQEAKPLSTAPTSLPKQNVEPAPAVVTPPVAPVVIQPTTPTSYTSKEGVTTVSSGSETPEQARARTAATAQQNIAARQASKPTTSQP